MTRTARATGANNPTVTRCFIAKTVHPLGNSEGGSAPLPNPPPRNSLRGQSPRSKWNHKGAAIGQRRHVSLLRQPPEAARMPRLRHPAIPLAAGRVLDRSGKPIRATFAKTPRLHHRPHTFVDEEGIRFGPLDQRTLDGAEDRIGAEALCAASSYIGTRGVA